MSLHLIDMIFVPVMQRTVKVYKVDSFTKQGSGGSPTGVVLAAGALDDADMQMLAGKIDVSHTAFVTEPTNPGENIKVRFFTPNGEILNCGHGTIAVHYTRAKIYHYTGSEIIFQETKEGVQRVEIMMATNDFEIYLQQNEILFSDVNSFVVESLLKAFLLNSTDLATDLPVVLASPGSNRFLLGLRSSAIANSLAPDLDELKNICTDHKSIGCFVYAMDSMQPNPEATARMFAPNIGVNEDIINGNSSGCLGAYLLALSGQNNIELLISQGQKFNRDGLVKVKAAKINGHIKTVIGGGAKIQGITEFTLD